MRPQHQPRGRGPLAALRVARGLSQPEMAKRIGVSRAHWVNIERGVADTTVARVRRIAEALGCPLAEALMAVVACRPARKPKRRKGMRAA